jgi:ABC-type antimicrobial peptide transport system permease subunit
MWNKANDQPGVEPLPEINGLASFILVFLLILFPIAAIAFTIILFLNLAGLINVPAPWWQQLLSIVGAGLAAIGIYDLIQWRKRGILLLVTLIGIEPVVTGKLVSVTLQNVFSPLLAMLLLFLLLRICYGSKWKHLT